MATAIWAAASTASTGLPPGRAAIFGVDTPCAVAFGVNNTEINTEQFFTGRVDSNISDKQKLFFRYQSTMRACRPPAPAPSIRCITRSAISRPIRSASPHLGNHPDHGQHVHRFGPLVYRSVRRAELHQDAMPLMPDSIAIGDGGANGGGFATVGGGSPGFPTAATSATSRSTMTSPGPRARTPSRPA